MEDTVTIKLKLTVNKKHLVELKNEWNCEDDSNREFLQDVARDCLHQIEDKFRTSLGIENENNLTVTFNK